LVGCFVFSFLHKSNLTFSGLMETKLLYFLSTKGLWTNWREKRMKWGDSLSFLFFSFLFRTTLRIPAKRRSAFQLEREGERERGEREKHRSEFFHRDQRFVKTRSLWCLPGLDAHERFEQVREGVFLHYTIEISQFVELRSLWLTHGSFLSLVRTSLSSFGCCFKLHFFANVSLCFLDGRKGCNRKCNSAC